MADDPSKSLKKVIKLLDDVFSEIEESLSVPSYSKTCEIDPVIARRLLTRYLKFTGRQR